MIPVQIITEKIYNTKLHNIIYDFMCLFLLMFQKRILFFHLCVVLIPEMCQHMKKEIE